MTTERMTVHKALTELKVIPNRITGKILETDFVGTAIHSSKKVAGKPIDVFKQETISAYDRITDLIKRMEAINRAVVKSNAITTVVIAGTQFTVAEAIYMKNHGMEMYNQLLSRITSKSKGAYATAEKANTYDLPGKAERHVEALLANVDKEDKAERAAKARTEYIVDNTIDVIDPIKSSEKISYLEKKINDFMVEVDSALSVSNAITEIEINY